MAAGSAGLEAFFNPKSVAIVGATPKEGKVGRIILENFIKRFKGKIFPVNPKYNEILGLKCYPTVKDIPEPVDLVVISIPAPSVPKVLEDAGEKGVKGAIIISGGFRETGTEEGRALEEKVVEIAKKYGIRIIGPNCLGIYDNWTGVDTFFLPDEKMKRPKRGLISFISQSGAFASALLDWMAYNNIGISRAISYGNKVDVDDVDLIEFLGKDDKTGIIVMYIEGIKTGRGKLFLEKAREIAKKKPIVVFKAGKTARGSRAAASHTAALAGNYSIYQAAFKQAGIIEALSFDEIMDFAKVLLTQPLMNGNRVFVVTDAGGIGVMLTDALTKEGFELPPTPDDLKKELREVLPPHCIVENPIDLTGDADDDRYRIVLEKILPKPYVDAVVVGALPQIPGMTKKIVDYFVELKKYGKPMIIINIGSEEAEKFKVELENKGIPVYESPERAARALKALYLYSMYRKRWSQ
ncbi:CoA-binding protein [Desulfurococcaceae archaeon MEX13E-LK6-19]|nr:CoA-binding protein [Desulfurococcaceae archaeon MEX13E-LK6-19]